MTAAEFGGFPLTVGSVRGYRQWYADALGRLYGLSYNDVWTPGENVKTCHSANTKTNRGKPCTIDLCSCGFYAYYDTVKPIFQVGGVIEGYGETAVGTKGFRCSKAKILALWFPDLTYGDNEIEEQEEEEEETFTFSAVPTTTNTTTTVTVAYGGWGNELDSVLDQDRLNKVEHNYGKSIEIFTDWDKMVEKYPTTSTKLILPTPETDPTFWSRPLVK